MKKYLALVVAVVMTISLIFPSIASANGNETGNTKGTQKFALLIGISDYPGPLSALEGGLDLYYAAQDASAVADALVGNYGFDAENITLLPNDTATRPNIMAAIRSLRAKARPGDEVVFYFSGHAVIPEAVPPEPVAGLWNPRRAPADSDVGILVWDSHGQAEQHNPKKTEQTAIIFDTELGNEFARFQTNRMLFGFDSCWAGRFEEVARPGVVAVMASGSTPDAIAGEYGEAYAFLGFGPLPGLGWLNQGLFTHLFVVQDLTWQLAPDLDGDQVISVQEAFAHASYCLSLLTDLAAAGLNEVPVMIDQSGGDFHL